MRRLIPFFAPIIAAITLGLPRAACAATDDRLFGASYRIYSGFAGTPSVLDLDEDGRLDVVNGDGWFRGNGDLTFAAERRFGLLGVDPLAIVRDLNHDGHADVVGYSIGEGIGVFLGPGDGTMRLRRTFPVGGSIRSLEVTDVDEDGLQDIVAGVGTSLLVLFATNDLVEFGLPTSISGRGTFRSIVAADFNRDGHCDIAAATYAARLVLVFLGHGDGTFEVREVAVDNYGSLLLVSDIDDDGIPDLIASSTVLRGSGSGSFSVVGHIDNSEFILAGDFDGDSHADLLSGGPIATVWRGFGNGTFAPVETLFVSSWHAAVGDLDEKRFALVR